MCALRRFETTTDTPVGDVIDALVEIYNSILRIDRLAREVYIAPHPPAHTARKRCFAKRACGRGDVSTVAKRLGRAVIPGHARPRMPLLCFKSLHVGRLAGQPPSLCTRVSSVAVLTLCWQPLYVYTLQPSHAFANRAHRWSSWQSMASPNPWRLLGKDMITASPLQHTTAQRICNRAMYHRFT